MNENKLSFFILKIFSYALGIFQAVLYTPIVLSISLFIIIIPMLFQSEYINSLFSFFPNGNYTTTNILTLYGKYAFGLSLLIALAETVFRKRVVIEAKKKIILLGLSLLVGYCLTFIFFITKTELTTGNTLIVLIPFFLMSFFAAILNALFTVLTKFVNKHMDGPRDLPTNYTL